MCPTSVITASLLGPLLFGGVEDEVLVHRQVETMGTVLWTEVSAKSRKVGLAASEEALKAVEAARDRLSTWTHESELACFLSSDVGEEVELSPLLAAELIRARRLSILTGGAFDPSVGALSKAWGLRSGGREPSKQELERALSECGQDKWGLEGCIARRWHPQLSIDEGGFGKGAALDQALSALRDAGVCRATLNLGGQLAFLGDAEHVVPVADPRDRGSSLLELRVDGGSVATSANTERAGHLIDPRSGLPAADFGSVTVWAADGLTADALSTGLFVLGPEEGLALAEETPGIEAAFIVYTGKDRAVLLSSGLRERTRPLVPIDLPFQVVIER